jgi:hypothetical protein
VATEPATAVLSDVATEPLSASATSRDLTTALMMPAQPAVFPLSTM